MSRKSKWTPLRAVLLALALLPLAVLADPPARVGRISEFGGTLYLASPDTGNNWKEIGFNYPVTTGDNLYVAPGGRAEIDFGAGYLRFAGDTNVNITVLDDHRIGLYVASGQIALRLRYLDGGDAATIQTPNAQIVLTRAGNYRVDVARDSTTLTTREGEAELKIAGAHQRVTSGQSITLAGIDAPMVRVAQIHGYDAFDAWNEARDRRYETAVSSYVSRDMVGWRDLEDNGYWEQSPAYGAVWYPTAIASGWAPYRFGHWAWVSPWGWTWIDDARWGYAPFHYGRWVWIGSRWGWCPGAYAARPIYAPALVAFYGGPGWSFNVGSGPLYSWVPLGWDEPYYPLHAFSVAYWRQVNTPYVTNIAERPVKPPAIYSNVNVPGAVTVVPGAIFTGAKPVGTNVVNVPPSALLNVPAITSPTALVMKPTSNGMIVKPVGQVPPPAATFIKPYTTGRATVTESSPVRPIAPAMQHPAATGGSAYALHMAPPAMPKPPVLPRETRAGAPAYGGPGMPPAAYGKPYRNEIPGAALAPRPRPMPLAVERTHTEAPAHPGGAPFAPAAMQPAPPVGPHVHEGRAAPAAEIKVRPN